MTVSGLLEVLGLVYGGSEVALAFVRHSRSGSARSTDRGTLGILWVVIVLAIAGGILVAGRRLAPLPGSLRAWSLAGIVLLVGGLALRWTAILTLRRAFTVDVAIAGDQRIVDRGVYRFLRHPAYTGNLLAFAGLALAFGDALGWAVMVLPIAVAFAYRIRIEERALFSAFGEDYARYACRTRRLIPFVY
ncbi:MAG TPA: isoprenylcysteine carboxylmethyltransferase family protein [Terriglobales bacterium]|nr:isoprenylcysteine carboxylmethyltransferase family protein [Terriglobales bacterium]